MDRRTFMASLTAGATSIGGCLSRGNKNQSIEATDSIRIENTEFSAGQAMAKKYLRFWDQESESIKQLEAESGWWFLVTVECANLGEEAISTPSVDNFKLISNGEEDPLWNEMPRIDWEQVRLRDEYKMYWTDPSSWPISDEISGGEDALYYLITDAESTTDPIVKVDHMGETGYLKETWVHGPLD